MKISEEKIDKATKARAVNSVKQQVASQISLRNRVKFYKKRVQEVKYHLSKKPIEWGKFQNEFNVEIDAIFRNIMDFEKGNFDSKNKTDKLKLLFINKFREFFVKGTYIEWSLRKPFGYPGDYRIIDDIYRNHPKTTGYDRLFDNYYQMLAISAAVRNRKEDFKRRIIDFANSKQGNPVRIMNLACGSARDIKEILSSENLLNSNLVFDCYDHDMRAIKYAKSLLGDCPNVHFFKQNALRMAATRNSESKINEKYDFIYSMGLFDYLNHKVSMRLVCNLKKLLKTEGVLAVSSVRDKHSNPSVHFMEWVGDWNLVYRSDNEFQKIFTDGGFSYDKLSIQYEQQGIMLYIFATKKLEKP